MSVDLDYQMISLRRKGTFTAKVTPRREHSRKSAPSKSRASSFNHDHFALPEVIQRIFVYFDTQT